MPSSPLAQPGLRDLPMPVSGRGLAVLFSVVALLVITRWDLASAELHAMFGRGNWVADTDWLLVGLGIFFLFCATYDVQPRPDLATLAAGFVGGTLIEIWGTRTGLWHYFTWERPPLWILPAWSMSALANERLLRLFLLRLSPRARERVIADSDGGIAWRRAYYSVFGAFFAGLLWWTRQRFWTLTTSWSACSCSARSGDRAFPSTL